jgi:hypothetical protein
VTEVDIWRDPSAAAIVRSVADGNETVPTVVIGSTALVNPSARRVVDTVQRLAPGHAVAGGTAEQAGRSGRRRAVMWAVLVAIVAGSFTADGAGYPGLSWGLDGVALAVWIGFRLTDR